MAVVIEVENNYSIIQVRQNQCNFPVVSMYDRLLSSFQTECSRDDVLKFQVEESNGSWLFCQAVVDMFTKAPRRTRFHNVRAIGLYGVGGLGKTTLCKSLCNYYFADFNGEVGDERC